MTGEAGEKLQFWERINALRGHVSAVSAGYLFIVGGEAARVDVASEAEGERRLWLGTRGINEVAAVFSRICGIAASALRCDYCQNC